MDMKTISMDPQLVTMEFNDVFQYIGDTGLYQILLYVILGLCSFFNGMQNMSSNFFAGHMDHWCKIPRLSNFSFDTQKLIGIPYEDGDPEVYDSCRMFDLNFSSLTNDQILTWDRSEYENVSTIECGGGWVYDQTEFVDTINSKYELVCSRDWMGELTSTIYMFGVLIGSVGSGSLSDRFGRKWIMIVALLGYVAFGVAQGFAPNYAAFVVFRFLVATFSMTSFLCSYVIVMELLGPTHYVLLATFVHVFFSVGFMLVSGLGYAIREIRFFFVAISVPVACTLPFIWAVPESPRWLIANGRSKEAEKTLRYISKVNRVTLPENIKWVQSKTKEVEQKKGTCGDLCSSPILCRELALIYLNWFTVSLVYYGVSFNAGAFGDVYLNTFLSGLIEVPANIICYIAMEKGGRRWSNGGSLLVTGVFCLSLIPVLIVRPELESVLTALSTLGKGAITFSFSSVYTYSSELFPTPVRHLAIGSSSMFARIGSMASPYLGSTLEDIWKPMPSVIFGGLAVFTGAIVFLLPETKGHPVPDTIAEAEEIGRFHKKGTVKKSDDENDLVIVVPEPEMKESNGHVNPAFTTYGSTKSEEKWNEAGNADIEEYTRL